MSKKKNKNHKKKRILFVVRAFFSKGPQAIRFQKIINFIYKQYNTHLLFLEDDFFPKSNIPSISLHCVEYTKLGKILNFQSHDNRFYYFIKGIFKQISFPDIISWEILNLKNKMKELILDYDFDYIILSGFPFSMLKLSKTIKKEQPRTKIIYDIGDPFFQNSLNGIFKNYLAYFYDKYYLKYLDELVVTNESTKLLYQKLNGKKKNNLRISVIPQGFDIDTVTLKKNNLYLKNDSEPIEFIYAGQFYSRLREPFNLYKAIQLINIKYPNKIILNIFGNHKKIFTKIPKELNDIIIFNKPVPIDELSKKYIESDVIIIIDNAYGYQVPGKIAEVLSKQKKVLFIYTNENSPVLRIIKEYRGANISKNEKKIIYNEIKKIIYSDLDCPAFPIDKYFPSWHEVSIMYRQLLSNSLKNME